MVKINPKSEIRNPKQIAKSKHRILKLNSVVLLATLYSLLATFLFAQDGGIPGAFLNYGMSPRTTALGKAFTGLADDEEAIYYNPAGLGQLYSHNIKSSFIQLFGHELGYLGYALPTRRYGTLGVNIIHFRAKNVDSRDENMNSFQPFYFAQSCFILAYANPVAKPLSLGVNLKFVNTKIAQYTAIGAGGDIGLFLFPRQNYTFGIAAQNLLGPKLTFTDGGETDEYPITFRFGGAIKLYQGRAIIVGDIVKDILEYTSIKPRLGFEFSPVYPILTIRAGVDENALNAGLGIRQFFGNMSAGIDYAVEMHYKSNFLLPIRHRIGISVEFGGFRTWVSATPKQFSPTPGRKENVTWLDLHYSTKGEIQRWQLLIKNGFGEVVRTYSGWDAPPLRLSWDGLDDVGRRVADGRYYYEIVIISKDGDTISFSDFLVNVVTLGPAGEIEFIPQE